MQWWNTEFPPKLKPSYQIVQAMICWQLWNGEIQFTLEACFLGEGSIRTIVRISTICQACYILGYKTYPPHEFSQWSLCKTTKLGSKFYLYVGRNQIQVGLSLILMGHLGETRPELHGFLHQESQGIFRVF